MSSRTRPFGRLGGREVTAFELENTNGVVVGLTDYGATVTRVSVPDRDGRFEDVVAGFDDVEGYLSCPAYFGCIVGRVANRIAQARFALEERRYELAPNDPPHHLHGGPDGFHRVLWAAEAIEVEGTAVHGAGEGVRFRMRSPDGDAGYPGAVEVQVTFTLTDEDELCVDMRATTDALTLGNLAHHGYWNLAGHAAGSVLEHELVLHADAITPGVGSVPDGTLAAVEGTPFDFRVAKQVGRDLERVPGPPPGYDHNFVVRGEPFALRPVAELSHRGSGRVLSLSANQPGVQLYTGNFLDGSLRGKGAAYAQHAALCLETQAFPNAINVPEWRNQVILEPGREYHHVMVHRFSVR